MHAAVSESGDVQFLYNPDLSGDVRIWLSADAVVEEDGYVTVTIDGQTLKSFILDRIRDNAVNRLDQATEPELLRMLGMLA